MATPYQYKNSDEINVLEFYKIRFYNEHRKRNPIELAQDKKWLLDIEYIKVLEKK